MTRPVLAEHDPMRRMAGDGEYRLPERAPLRRLVAYIRPSAPRMPDGGSADGHPDPGVEMEVDSMRRGIVILAVMGAVLLTAAAPGGAGAAEYKVTNKSGRTVGRVVPRPHPRPGGQDRRRA